MGFSTIAASIILFMGLLFFGSLVANAMFETQRETSRALDENRDRVDFEIAANITIKNGAHAGGNLHLNITNTGNVVLDASKVHIIIDGVWASDQITSTTVGGTSTNVWAPLEVLHVQATQASAPSRAVAVLETGRTATWTP